MSFATQHLPTFSAWLNKLRRNKTVKAGLKKPGILVGIAVLIFLVLGIVAATVLTQINQDVRQQAYIAESGGGGGGGSSSPGSKCAIAGGSCKSSCNNTSEYETYTGQDCSSGKCCAPKPADKGTPSCGGGVCVPSGTNCPTGMQDGGGCNQGYKACCQKTMVCTPNQSKCDEVNKKIIKCLPDGTGWTFTSELCGQTAQSATSCPQSSCVKGATKCISTRQISVCKEKKETIGNQNCTYTIWEASTTCGKDNTGVQNICFEGKCIRDPSAAGSYGICPVGSKVSSTNNAKCVCNNITTNSPVEFSRSASATLPEACKLTCAAGQYSCDGQNVRHCSNGNWSISKICPENEECYKTSSGTADCRSITADANTQLKTGECYIIGDLSGVCMKANESTCSSRTHFESLSLCEAATSPNNIRKCCSSIGSVKYVPFSENCPNDFPINATISSDGLNSTRTNIDCPSATKKCCYTDNVSQIIDSSRNCPGEHQNKVYVAETSSTNNCDSVVNYKCYIYNQTNNNCTVSTVSKAECTSRQGMSESDCNQRIVQTNQRLFASAASCGCRCNYEGAQPLFLQSSVSSTARSCSDKGSDCRKANVNGNFTGTTWVDCPTKSASSVAERLTESNKNTDTAEKCCLCTFDDNDVVALKGNYLPQTSCSMDNAEWTCKYFKPNYRGGVKSVTWGDCSKGSSTAEITKTEISKNICCEVTKVGSDRKYYLTMTTDQCNSMYSQIGARGIVSEMSNCASSLPSGSGLESGSRPLAQVPSTNPPVTSTQPGPSSGGSTGGTTGGSGESASKPANQPQPTKVTACQNIGSSIRGVFCDGTMEEVRDSNGKTTCECVRKTKVFTFGGSGQGSLSNGYLASTLATDDSNLVSNYQKICGEVNKIYGANKDNYACFADLVFMKQSATSVVGYEYVDMSSTIKQILAVKKDSQNKKVVPRIVLHLSIPQDLTASESAAQIKAIYQGGIGGLDKQLFTDQTVLLSLDLSANRYSTDDLNKIYTAYKDAQVAAGHKYVTKTPFKLFIHENVKDGVLANSQFVPIDAVGGASDLAAKQKRTQTVSNAYFSNNVNKNIAGDLGCVIWNGAWVTKLTPAQQLDGVNNVFTDAMFKKYFTNKAASGTNKYNYQCDYYGVY